MVEIDKILIDDEVIEARFCCDLQKCKGACCTFPGEYGAPLLEEETGLIESNYPKIKKYLSEKSKNYIEEQGLYEGRENYRTTVCIDKRDCVFVYYDNDVALCAFEKAFLNGEIDFRKPISCHLYPIRIKKFGSDLLYYSRIEECTDAVIKGESENIPLLKSLEVSLRRRFGDEWYDKLINYLKSKNNI